MGSQKKPAQLEVEDNSTDLLGLDEFSNQDIDLDNNDLDFGGGGTTLDKHNDLLTTLTEFDAYLNELYVTWLGLKWSDTDKGYVPDGDMEAIINVKGAKTMINTLKTYTRKNNILTHIELRDYQMIMTDLIELVWLTLGTRREHYKIKHTADIHSICTQIEHAAALILMGAGKGKYSDLLKTTVNRSESVNLSDHGDGRGGARNKGMLGKMMDKIRGL